MSQVWKTAIEHVVVLMMENRSFDHLLGNFKKIDPQCEGVLAADGKRLDRANRVRELARNFYQQANAPTELALQLDPAPFDPMHEFRNCLLQLGTDLNNPTMLGFAQDAYDSYKDKAGCKEKIADLVQQVMNYVPFGDSPAQDPLPGIQGLARAFTVCDHWFCSLPGPTFANRFFAMMGSCHGRVLMPSDWHDAPLALRDYCDQISQDSIFSLVNESGRKDKSGRQARVYSQGHTPFAFMARDGGNRFPMSQFYSDSAAGKLPALSWIEPDYSYEGSDGCSQHPPEDLRYGDAFIAQVYNALRANDGAWNKTLFVVLYDEHGGLYDHVPPPATVAPDGYKADVNFDFTRLGPRVPALLASPWLGRQVDKNQYDHTSLLAFICDRFGIDRTRLGKRVASTRHFGDANIWLAAPRSDTPKTLRLAQFPARSAKEIKHETPLAKEIASLIEALHLHLNVDELQDSVWQKLRPLGRLVGHVQPPEKLDNMITEILAKLAQKH